MMPRGGWNKGKTTETDERVKAMGKAISRALTGVPGHPVSIGTRKAIGQKSSSGTKAPTSIYEVSSRTRLKILRRMQLSCFVCGWDKAVCDVHHIVPKTKGGTHDHSNLTVLCPNCHRLAHDKKLVDVPTIETVVGDRWKEHYYAYAKV
jgi:5-methylcytosine-specific restriction endonuclease McrA